MRRIAVVILLALVVFLVALAIGLIGAALWCAQLAWATQSDRVTWRGNQITRLEQRLDEVLGKLDAALRIGLERINIR